MFSNSEDKKTIEELIDQNLLDSFPFPMIFLKSQKNSAELISFNKLFIEANNRLSIFPSKNLERGDIISYGNETALKSLRESKIIEDMIENILKRGIGSTETITFYVDSIVYDEDGNSISDQCQRVPVNLRFFKAKEKIVGIMFDYLFESLKKNDESIIEDFSRMAVFDCLPNAIFEIKKNKIIYVNSNLVKLLGYSDKTGIIGRRIEEFVYPDDLQDFLKYLDNVMNEKSLQDDDQIYRFIKINGEIIWFSLSHELYHPFNKIEKSVLFSALDVSEKKKTEIALLQTHRLASVGDLTAGMAHEINNPLFGIMNYAALIKDSVDTGVLITKDSEEYEFLVGITEEAERISKIITNLSEFSRKSEDKEFSATELPKVINKIEKLLAYQIRHTHVKIEKKIPEDLPKMMLQQYRIEHALFNLILNAIQALGDVEGRKRIIRITINIDKNLDPHRLIVKIYDNGMGISDENMIKLFNPFFTTRRGVKGTGLGLHTVFNIVTDHNGRINADSKLGEWTEFVMDLPIKYA